MDEGDQKRQLIDERTEGTGRLRGGVERGRTGAGRARSAVEDAGWFLRQRVAWPVEDSLERLGRRGAIGVFGGGGIAIAGVVAALVIAGSGSSSTSAGTTEAFVVPPCAAPPAAVTPTPAPAPKPKASKPTGPTLHGAPPDFYPAEEVRSGVADSQAVSKGPKKADASPKEKPASSDATASSVEAPASTAKIGATPAATASAQAQASSLAKASGAEVEETSTGQGGTGKAGTEFTGPPAPKAAKKVARRFAEAFVVYEIGGIDTKVRKAFNQTSTKQLSRSLLRRPPRQPASVKVPQAKVVNVVAGPSQGKVYTVSVSLLRVGVTSELRLEMEQGVGKKWQVTNVFG